MRTLLIALAVLPLAVPLSACSDDKRETETKRPTRIVCSDAGRVYHDDFATADEFADASQGYLNYVSQSQQGRVRVTGNCTTYPSDMPPGWKPVIQGK